MLFKDRFATKSAGLYSGNLLTKSQILWADSIVVMEERQRSEIARRFPKEYLKKRIISWDIPDIFRYNDPELIGLLNNKVESLV